jgi:kinesin family protein C1
MSEKRLLRPPTKVTTSLPLKSNTLKVSAKSSSKENVLVKRKVVDDSSMSKKQKVGEKSEAPKKKRAAWDVKGRLQDLEAFHQKTEERLGTSNTMIDKLQTELSTSQNTINELKEFKFKLEHDVQERSRENSTIGQELETLKVELKNLNIQHEKEILDLTKEKEFKIQEILKEKEEIMVKKSSLERDLANFVTQNDELKVS